MKSEKILILGSEGFIGKSILNKLIRTKKSLTLLIRNSQKIKKDKKINCDMLNKDIFDLTKEDIDKFEIIINCAGSLGGFKKSKEELLRSNYETAKKLIDICTNQKIVHISSCGVLGPIINGNEQSKPNPTNDYELSKAKAEDAIRMYENHAILRPEFVYGEKDKHLLGFFRAIKNKQFRLIGKGNSLIHPTYIDDLTSAIISCIDKNIKNETIIVAGEKAVTIKEHYYTVCKIMNIKPNKYSIPKPLAYITAFCFEIFGRIVPFFNPPLTIDRVKFLTQNRSFNTIKAQKLLSYNPIKFEDGIKKTIMYYQKNNLL